MIVDDDLNNLDAKFQQALAYHDNGDIDKAIDAYHKLLTQKEDWQEVHYNLGLIYKYELNWEKSFFHNQRSVELDPENEGSLWNLGIASTMLEKWRIARQCWNHFGMTYADTDDDTGVDRPNFGMMLIRLYVYDESNDEPTNHEDVWAFRIDPARAILQNIPMLTSAFRYGDIVLQDGNPIDYKTYNNEEYPIYELLEILVPSDFAEYSLTTKHNTEQFNSLVKQCQRYSEQHELIQIQKSPLICKSCRDGEVHEHKTDTSEHTESILFATKNKDALQAILQKWSAETGVNVEELKEL